VSGLQDLAEDIFHHGDTVALYGRAGGTIRVNGELLPENTWQIPAAWRPVVRDGLIREWRVCPRPQAGLRHPGEIG
jgi:hypothetical protein